MEQQSLPLLELRELPELPEDCWLVDDELLCGNELELVTELALSTEVPEEAGGGGGGGAPLEAEEELLCDPPDDVVLAEDVPPEEAGGGGELMLVVEELGGLPCDLPEETVLAEEVSPEEVPPEEVGGSTVLLLEPVEPLLALELLEPPLGLEPPLTSSAVIINQYEMFADTCVHLFWSALKRHNSYDVKDDRDILRVEGQNRPAAYRLRAD